MSHLGTALGGLISCELELKRAPCEIAPIEAAEREALAAELRGGAAEVQSARGSVRNLIPAAEATLFGNQPVPRPAL